MRIKMFLNGFLRPLPDPEKEAQKFFTSPLHHLCFDHIKEVVRLIIDEARESRKFDFFIEKPHIEKEELFFLATINGLGGVWRMRRVIVFDEAREVISGLMWEHFEQELRYYFELAEKRNEFPLNKYNCHLESALDRLLHEIYLVPNKAFHTL